MEIEKSPQDDREYKILTLNSNSLTTLLISDPTTDKSSAALDVRIGHLSDPDNLPGLAHFLEHLLFMGTEKYPNENEYNVYLSNHGGSSNAYTDLESTNYYFDISSTSTSSTESPLVGALDRFAQFFIHPLFLPNTTNKEILAVDSEHAKNLQNDTWRQFQLFKSLANPSHPYSKFGSGNLTTLQTNPEKRGLDTRQELIQFHQQFYSANIMKLVVYGKESIEELESIVSNLFSSIPNYDKAIPTFPGTPFGRTQLCKIVNIIPVKEGIQSLKLHFPTREIDTLYKSKPTHYISHLIGHEGKGSILELLKHKGWSNGLSAGSSRSCTDWSCFTITIELTNNGLEHIHDIIEIIFAYIKLLQKDGVQQWIYDEIETVSQCSFRFLNKRNPIDYTSMLACALHSYEPEDILSGPYKVWDYNPALIREFLDTYFTPANMLLFVTSKTFEGKTTCQEQWYGTEYDIEDIPTDLSTKWSNATVECDLVENMLHLPEQNDMIASDFTLVNHNVSTDVLPMDEPKLILNTNRCRLWYKPDNVFDMPKVNILSLLRTKASSTMSVMHSVLALLWTQIVTEHSNDYTYLASMASLHISIANVQQGIELSVSGYNHKVHKLLQRIVKTIMDVPIKLELSLFERVKDKVYKEYQNFAFAQPYQHAFYAADLCIETSKWSIEDKLMALQSIELHDIIHFSHQLLSCFQLEILIHGNVTIEGAKEISSILLNGLNPSPPPPSMLPTLRVVQLQEKREYIHRMPEPNEGNTNSCIEFLLQTGPLPLKDVSILALVHQLIKEPAFNELRTNEQLGYIVHTSVKTNGDDVKGLLFLIQSDSFDPIHMDDRIEAFLVRSRSTIMNMSEDAFNANVNSLIQVFTEKKKNTAEESDQYWTAITTNHYLFQRLKLIANYLASTSRNDVLRFYDKHIAKGSPLRRKLSVQVFATQHMEKYTTPIIDSDYGVLIYPDDVDEFKNCMPLFPLVAKVDIKPFLLKGEGDSRIDGDDETLAN